MAVKKKATKAKAKVVKAVKKPAAKKVVAKKAVKAAPAKVAKPVAVKSVEKAYTKSQVMTYLADQAGISKKQATDTFAALVGLIGAHLKSKPASFTLPGLAKCVVVRKPATKARKGVNPFTGEPTTFKAKPARNVVKIRPLKAMKEMV